MQQSMKTMNLMMPIMSAVFCLNLPAGMGIYWIAGAVVRSIQQIIINRHIDKIDIDAEIAKNTAKYKEKMEKNKTTRQMNLYASLSTKNNDLSSSASGSGISDSEKEEKMQKVADIYGKGNIRKDSLLAKANMVKEFNEKNNK
jgi:YidC/Oxa1 family membrane protein insertase